MTGERKSDFREVSMPTNRSRRTRGRNAGHVTPAAVDAFKKADHCALFHELALPPWHHSPLEPEADPLIMPPPSYDSEAGRTRAQELRETLAC